ncbi:hypothetical protein AK830_g5895 [Neonectria ditissima]|uniref:FYVE-type domain-containing protein n=1 Tax=Neonectria ditissima TaxID=78410 RepID=A0A0P7ASB7_9HYPO|nr:hypothetical protein AK830_g5895 [Neonectria ditissima]
MASPAGATGPLASGDDSRAYEDLLDSESESESGSSSDSHQNHNPSICPWRTPQFNDRECLRFFDCPSHLVERSLSVAGSIHEVTDDEAAAENSDLDQRGVAGTLSGPGLSSESAHPQDDIYDAEPSPNLEEASNIATSTNNTDLPASTSNTRDLDETGDPMNAFPEIQTPPPPQDEPRSNSPPSSANTSEQSATHGETAGHPSLGSEGERGLPGLPEPRRERTPISRERMDAPLPSPRRTLGEALAALPPLPAPPPPPHGDAEGSVTSEWSVPRWQPDAEVTLCPICRAQFSFFVRKHHCRKCGRVVCNSCSPHRIIIPHQYIVRAPGSDVGIPQSLMIDGLGAGYFDIRNISGGERPKLPGDPITKTPASEIEEQCWVPIWNAASVKPTWSSLWTRVQQQHIPVSVFSDKEYHYGQSSFGIRAWVVIPPCAKWNTSNPHRTSIIWWFVVFILSQPVQSAQRSSSIVFAATSPPANSTNPGRGRMPHLSPRAAVPEPSELRGSPRNPYHDVHPNT